MATATADTFFDELKIWSEIKLRILAKYLDAYRRIRGGFHSTIYFVDGFAGAGKFRTSMNSSESQDGSPVILAKLAQHVLDSDRGYRLVCINTEIDNNNFQSLKESLAP